MCVICAQDKMKLRLRHFLWLMYVLAIGRFLLPPWLEADTKYLISATRSALGCAAQGHWTGCWAGPFPLLQKSLWS